TLRRGEEGVHMHIFTCVVRFHESGARYRTTTTRLSIPVRGQSLRFDRGGATLWLKVIDINAGGLQLELSPDGVTEEELYAAGWHKLQD
ncbi:MAG TPA: hypothetical protein VFY28_02535, partial [Candidatus Paceibacterota bacterium]|nr:hypothetical protein [Candidatus Paceibacterota bacterium]